MKKILLIFILLLSLSSCGDISSRINTDGTNSYTEEIRQELSDEFHGIWLPVYEYAPEKKDESYFIDKIRLMCDNMKNFGITDVFVQVRANGDAVYPSKLFAYSPYFSDGKSLCFDALNIMCSEIHSHNMKIHAWINPYRLCSDLSAGEFEKPQGIADGDIFQCGNKMYLVPASQTARTLILNGVREILENYPVDGIHIDDYFYPTDKKEIDSDFYGKFVKDGGRDALEDYRRNNVSALVSSIYGVTKSFGSDKIFSVSPGGNIESDYSRLYADVKKWCTEQGYLDLVIPQIYFGFENESQPFEKCLSKWKNITSDSEKRLAVGLSVYKAGKDDKYAGAGGRKEWQENSDIIMREIMLLRKEKCRGFCLFSYNYVFGNKEFTENEIKNVKSVLQ